MIHPAHNIKEPASDPDFVSRSNDIWFREGVYSYKLSNGEFEICPLAGCPLTGKLMYMSHSWPLLWIIIQDGRIEEAYMRYLVEKDMLGIFDEAIKQESLKT